MRVIGLQDLGNCPQGTILSDFEPCVVTDLYQLDSVIRFRSNGYPGSDHQDGDVIDFFYRSLIPECDNCPYSHPLDDDKPNLIIEDSYSRWGLFERDAKFVLYEAADLQKLIAILQEGIPS